MEFIKQFNTLESTYINCIETSKLLYEALLTKFKISLESDSYEILLTYQHSVYDMVERMRELDLDQIKSILIVLDKENPYLLDIVIMCWSLPRVNECMSQTAYNKKYKSNISTYNHTLNNLVEFYPIKNFCIETLTKTNNVPVHCIDILWYYMSKLSIDFLFSGDTNCRYIGIKIDEDDTEFTCFNFHLKYVLDMGLGRTIFESDHTNKGPMIYLLKKFVIDPEFTKSFELGPESSSKNYMKQRNQILAKFDEYFSEIK